MRHLGIREINEGDDEFRYYIECYENQDGQETSWLIEALKAFVGGGMVYYAASWLVGLVVVA